MIMTRFDLAYTAITQFIVAKVNRFLLSSPWFWSRRKLRSLVSQCYLHSLIEYTDVVVVLDNEAICSSIINTNRIIAQAISSLTTSLHFDESRMQTWKARLNLDSSSSFCGDRRHHMRYIYPLFSASAIVQRIRIQTNFFLLRCWAALCPLKVKAGTDGGDAQ